MSGGERPESLVSDLTQPDNEATKLCPRRPLINPGEVPASPIVEAIDPGGWRGAWKVGLIARVHINPTTAGWDVTPQDVRDRLCEFGEEGRRDTFGQTGAKDRGRGAALHRRIPPTD